MYPTLTKNIMILDSKRAVILEPVLIWTFKAWRLYSVHSHTETLFRIFENLELCVAIRYGTCFPSQFLFLPPAPQFLRYGPPRSRLGVTNICSISSDLRNRIGSGYGGLKVFHQPSGSVRQGEEFWSWINWLSRDSTPGLLFRSRELYRLSYQALVPAEYRFGFYMYQSHNKFGNRPSIHHVMDLLPAQI